jgi:asparagine synthase (glutamine-hydrolysing)
MDLGYLGGARADTWAGDAPARGDGGWECGGGAARLFVRPRGAVVRLFTWDTLALLVRGVVRPAGSSGPLDVERVAEELRCHYLENGGLAVDGLEGSFTLALLDGQAGRVVLYRNLVGTGFTYYHASGERFLFGSNLADLVDAVGDRPRPNRAALPTLFLYRSIPGPETLFEGFHRLLPGEQVAWDGRGLDRVQRHVFADLRGPVIGPDEAVDRLEGVMTGVVADCAAAWPGAANLLSGGVDSSYLQAIWNRVAADNPLPPSWSVNVDHPRSWPDTDYAVTASQALGTRHALMPANGPYAGYLLDTLAATGEPPNHVQTAYFGHLARAMVAHGVGAGLCGEGADSLFGLGLANRLHNAGTLRKLVPMRWPRRVLGAVAGAVGWGTLRATCRLAEGMGDYADLEHPVNQVAAFADWPAATACFGADAVAHAAGRRRALLDRLGVAAGPQDRLHAAGFLGEAVDSASLWATLFHRAGADLLCPFLDSRVLRLALNLAPEVRFRYRRPKDLLKRALLRHLPDRFVNRPKLGFGQPIFEWLAPGGQLRPLVDAIADYDFVDRSTLARVRERPSWFLYSLLCYDLWHKLFMGRNLPHGPRQPDFADAPALASGH